uniref:Uncharacterized protein n=1 Tax=viral metagenome TaxID=1070528 RepID=A0A6C0BUR2_9ZZZZ
MLKVTKKQRIKKIQGKRGTHSKKGTQSKGGTHSKKGTQSKRGTHSKKGTRKINRRINNLKKPKTNRKRGHLNLKKRTLKNMRGGVPDKSSFGSSVFPDSSGNIDVSLNLVERRMTPEEAREFTPIETDQKPPRTIADPFEVELTKVNGREILNPLFEGEDENIIPREKIKTSPKIPARKIPARTEKIKMKKLGKREEQLPPPSTQDTSFSTVPVSQKPVIKDSIIQETSFSTSDASQNPPPSTGDASQNPVSSIMQEISFSTSDASQNPVITRKPPLSTLDASENLVDSNSIHGTLSPVSGETPVSTSDISRQASVDEDYEMVEREFKETPLDKLIMPIDQNQETFDEQANEYEIITATLDDPTKSAVLSKIGEKLKISEATPGKIEEEMKKPEKRGIFVRLFGKLKNLIGKISFSKNKAKKTEIKELIKKKLDDTKFSELKREMDELKVDSDELLFKAIIENRESTRSLFKLFNIDKEELTKMLETFRSEVLLETIYWIDRDVKTQIEPLNLQITELISQNEELGKKLNELAEKAEEENPVIVEVVKKGIDEEDIQKIMTLLVTDKEPDLVKETESEEMKATINELVEKVRDLTQQIQTKKALEEARLEPEVPAKQSEEARLEPKEEEESEEEEEESEEEEEEEEEEKKAQVPAKQPEQIISISPEQLLDNKTIVIKIMMPRAAQIDTLSDTGNTAEEQIASIADIQNPKPLAENPETLSEKAKKAAINMEAEKEAEKEKKAAEKAREAAEKAKKAAIQQKDAEVEEEARKAREAAADMEAERAAKKAAEDMEVERVARELMDPPPPYSVKGGGTMNPATFHPAALSN